MIPQPPPQFPPKDPRESRILTLDATLDLPSGETLTGTPTVDITTIAGSDTTPSLQLTGVIVNSASLTVAGRTIAAGSAVQAVASAGTFGSRYLIAIVFPTTNPNETLVLKSVLPMSEI
jgi:hypothetical protein